MQNARREIRELYDAITASFSSLALADYRRNFHLPCLIASDQGVVVVADEAAFDALFIPMMEQLRAQGFVRSAVLHQHIAILGAATAMTSVLWVRYRANDEELERLGATYTLTLGADGWRICAIVVHAPERVLAIDQD